MASEADSERFSDAVKVKEKERSYVMIDAIDATRLRFLEALRRGGLT
jgi:hypothetical protein